MTRRSKRELEWVIEDLEVDDPDASFGDREGVTAEFVSYEADALADAEIPDGWTVSTSTLASGVVIRCLEPQAVEGDR